MYSLIDYAFIATCVCECLGPCWFSSCLFINSLKPTIHPQCPCSWQCNARRALIRERRASRAAWFIRWHANVLLLTEKTWGCHLLVLALACTWARCTSQQADRIKTSEIAAWPESGISISNPNHHNSSTGPNSLSLQICNDLLFLVCLLACLLLRCLFLCLSIYFLVLAAEKCKKKKKKSMCPEKIMTWWSDLWDFRNAGSFFEEIKLYVSSY